MANKETTLQKCRIMSSTKFNQISETEDSELYFVDASNYFKNMLLSLVSLNLAGRVDCGISDTNRTFNVTTDGFLIGSICIASNSSPTVSITRNNVVYTIYQLQGASKEVVTNNIFVPVKKGDVFTIADGTIKDYKIYLYPIQVEV